MDFLSSYNKTLVKYLEVDFEVLLIHLPISLNATNTAPLNNHTTVVPESSAAVLPPCPQA
jgi:hypothetical protein